MASTEFIISWNILPQDKSDLPYYLNEATKFIEKNLEEKQIKVPQHIASHLTTSHQYTPLYALLKTRQIRYILKEMNSCKSLNTLINRAADRAFSELNGKTICVKNRPLKLYISDKTFFMSKLKAFAEKPTTFREKLEAELPENSLLREKDLWKNRKYYVINALKEACKIEPGVPTAILLQGASPEQLRDIRNAFRNKDWKWISHSTLRGTPTFERSWYTPAGNHHAILLNKNGWVHEATKINWLTKNRDLVLGVKALNKTTKSSRWLYTTQPGNLTPLNDILDSHNIPYYLGGTFNLQRKLSFDFFTLDKQNHITPFNPYCRFFISPHTRQATFASLPCSSTKMPLNHIFVHPRLTVTGATIIPVLYGKELISLESPTFKKHLEERDLASDHFLLTVAGRENDSR